MIALLPLFAATVGLPPNDPDNREHFYITVMVLIGALAVAFLKPDQAHDAFMAVGMVLTYWFGVKRGGGRNGTGGSDG